MKTFLTVLAFLTIAIFVNAVIMAVVYGYDWYNYGRYDYSNWVEYYAVTPSKDVFSSSERITFVSDAEWKKDVSAIWTDILFCEKEGKYTRVSESITTNPSRKASSRSTTLPWVYGGYVPDRTTTCYLESNITVIPNPKYTKTQTIIGPTFSIQKI